MKKGLRVYWQLFWSTFTISACTFGGGFVIIPLLKKKFVTDLHWIEEKEMLDLAAIAQSSPGAIAVNASILVGYRVAGIPGALVTIVGAVLPPLIIITAISMCYAAVRDNAVVAALLKGMQSGVAAVIADVVISLGGDVVRQKKVLPLLIMVGAFVATWFLGSTSCILFLSAGRWADLALFERAKQKGADVAC